MLESKKMNTEVKQKYLDDFTDGLQAHSKNKVNYNSMTTKEA